MVTSKVKIKEEDYRKYSNCSKEEIEEFIYNIAVDSSYCPQGYGFYGCWLTEENGEFFAVWKHWHSCD